MYMRKKRRKLERLIQKYAEQRDIHCPKQDNNADNEDSCDSCPSTSADAFTPPVVPGAFPTESLLEAFELFQKHFPELIPAINPIVSPHLSLPKDQAPKTIKESDQEISAISSIEEWAEFKYKVERICPLMLPFVAQLVKVDTSSHLMTDKSPMHSASTNTSLIEKVLDNRQHFIKLQAASDQMAVSACACSSSGEFMAVGCIDSSIFIYDMAKSGIEEEQSGPISLLRLEAYRSGNPNSNRSSSCRHLYLHRRRVNKIVALRGNDNLFLSCDEEGVTVLWHGATGRLIRKFKARNTNCANIALCTAPDGINNGAMFLSAHSDGAARFWSLDKSNYLRLLVHEFGVKQVSLRQLTGATATDTENVIRIWNLKTGLVLRVLEQMDTGCLALHLLDEERICAVSEAAIFHLSDIASATTPIKQKLELPAGGQITTLMPISFNSSLSLLLGSNKSRLFAVEFPRKEDDSTLKISPVTFQELSLNDSGVFAIKLQTDSIFIALN